MMLPPGLEAPRGILRILFVAAIVVLLLLLVVAAAPKASAGEGGAGALPQPSDVALPAGAPSRGQVVNDASKPATACGCALSGQYGACFTRAELVPLRNAAAILLPSCREQLAAKGEEIAAVRAALGASQAQVALLAAASKSREAVAELTGRAAAASPAVDLPWWRRFGTGVVLGAVIGAGAAVAITFAVVRTIQTAQTAGGSSAGLRLAPLVRW